MSGALVSWLPLKCGHQEREKEAEEREKREHDIALGNPLLNPTVDFSVRRR